jgi:rhamnogalacturonyl hydrolase YesR
MAGGYLTMLKATKEERYRRKAMECLDWLIANKSPGYEDYSWGKHFDFAGRGGGYPKFKPITIWTSLIGFAFIEAYETFGEKRYLDVTRSICNWIMRLPRNQTNSGLCLNYVPSTGQGDSTIHNHSMMAAALLARTSKHVNRSEYVQLAREVMKFSCTRQHRDGAWYYGEHPMYHWIDNFHTGYNLDSLKCYLENTEDKTYEDNLRRGFEFYIRHFFEETGRPKYYHNRTYPVDSQCASQAIETLAKLSDYHTQALPLAIKVANWTIDHMQDKRGYFYYRQYPLMKAKTPMLHWAQATTYKGLSLLYYRMR